MVQQLAIRGGQNSSGYSQKGPQTENENQPPLVQEQGHYVLPQGGNQETDLSRDKILESGYDQVKSQVETLAEKLRIIEGSSIHGNVDLDSLTNFPQVIMLPSSRH